MLPDPDADRRSAGYRECGRIPCLSSRPPRLESEIGGRSEACDRELPTRRLHRSTICGRLFRARGLLRGIGLSELCRSCRRVSRTRGGMRRRRLSWMRRWPSRMHHWAWSSCTSTGIGSARMRSSGARLRSIPTTRQPMNGTASICSSPAGPRRRFGKFSLRASATLFPCRSIPTFGFHHYYTGRYDEAVKQLKFVLEMNRNFPPAHLWLGRTFQELGQFDDALAEFQASRGNAPRMARFDCGARLRRGRRRPHR